MTLAACGGWRLYFLRKAENPARASGEWQRPVSPPCVPQKTEGLLQIFFYLCVDAPDGITILEENLFLYVFPIDEQVRIIFPFRGSFVPWTFFLRRQRQQR